MGGVGQHLAGDGGELQPAFDHVAQRPDQITRARREDRRPDQLAPTAVENQLGQPGFGAAGDVFSDEAIIAIHAQGFGAGSQPGGGRLGFGQPDLCQFRRGVGDTRYGAGGNA